MGAILILAMVLTGCGGSNAREDGGEGSLLGGSPTTETDEEGIVAGEEQDPDDFSEAEAAADPREELRVNAARLLAECRTACRGHAEACRAVGGCVSSPLERCETSCSKSYILN